MLVIKANKSHKVEVLKLLDEFRTTCFRIADPESLDVSDSATKLGGDIFDKTVDSKTSAIFIASEDGKYVGIVTIHKIPQIRKGMFGGEIEEMFVKEQFQGKGVAQKLMEVVENWAKEEKVEEIRLESGNELERAHAFYEKSGFTFYGRAYKKKLV